MLKLGGTLLRMYPMSFWIYLLGYLIFIGGAAFLVTCDALARVVLPGRELPVGVVTAALGAPALVFLVSRARRE